MSWFLPILFLAAFAVLAVFLIYRSRRNADPPKQGGGGGSRPPADDKRTVR